MPRPSRITQLDPEVRETVDRLIREGRATIDQIADHLQERLGEEAPSRASVGRYAKNARESMERYRQAQEIAKVWVGRLEEDPHSDVGMLLSKMLHSLAFQHIGELEGRGEGVGAEELFLLGRTMQAVASANKMSTERELKIRREVARELDRKVDEQAKQGEALTVDRFKAMIREVYGG